MTRLPSLASSFMIVFVLLGSCASPTQSGPPIPVTVTGGGSYLINSTVTMTANPTYSGSGTLTYNWAINGTATSQHTQTTYYSATFATTQSITVTVSDGKSSGSASANVVYHP